MSNDHVNMRGTGLVERDYRRLSGAHQRHMLDSLDEGNIPGRRARHDKVSMCLLRKEIEHVLPMRRALRLARNKRRLVLTAIAFLLVWVYGWYHLRF